jgi:bla regulator protein blaR1
LPLGGDGCILSVSYEVKMAIADEISGREGYMLRMRGNRRVLRRNMIAAIAGIATIFAASLISIPSARATRAEPQTQSAAAPKYEFDVVSIKIIGPDDPVLNLGTGFAADGMTANGVRLWWLFRMAYDMPMSQIVGMPSWVDDTRYLIEARIDPETADALKKLSPENLRVARQQMLRAMMAERFGLKFHTETRELPAYFLTIAKGGPKLQDAKTGDDGKSYFPDMSGDRATDLIAFGGGGQQPKLIGQAASMAALAAFISQWALTAAGVNARPVLDRTGLTGRYDFEVPYSREFMASAPPSADSAPGTPATVTQEFTAGPSLFKALEDSLGLKIESGKGPVPVFVIDHVEKPSAN